jgi:hypothetical protein
VGWWIFPIVGAVIVLCIVANRLGWIDLSDKSRKGGSGGSRGGGGVLGVVDEVFAPSRHEAQLELERQTRLPAPAPVAGDRDLGIFEGGRVSIRLDEHGNPID